MSTSSTFHLTIDHVAALAAAGYDTTQHPWRLVGPDGIGCTLRADSSVNGGGPALLGPEVPDRPDSPRAWEQTRPEFVVGFTPILEILLGADHPVLVQSRRATEIAIAAQRDQGRILAQMARDERRLLR